MKRTSPPPGRVGGDFTINQLIDKYTKYLYQLHIDKLKEDKILQAQEEKRREVQRAKLTKRHTMRQIDDDDEDDTKKQKKKTEEEKLVALFGMAIPAGSKEGLDLVRLDSQGDRSEDEEEQDEMTIKANRLRKLIKAK